jgi:hypothetical protein
VPIIQHADVKRMLLAQKAMPKAALALELYCARLVDELHTGDATAAAEAKLLLEVLTPIAKSWPSEWCLEANSLAIQVLGGYGYTRDFPVEQYWRDNRLNMIHEGTHGIQALDLLGRKVVMDGGAGLKLLATRISATIERAGQAEGLAEPANRAGRRAAEAGRGHQGRLGHRRARRGAGQRHALPAGLRPRGAGLDLAGRGAGRARPRPLAPGKLAAMRYFFAYELPKIDAWLGVVAAATTPRAPCATSGSDRHEHAKRHARQALDLGADLRRPADAGLGLFVLRGDAGLGWALVLPSAAVAVRRGAVLIVDAVATTRTRSLKTTPSRRPHGHPVQQLFDLTGQVALVTGGSRGLGLQMAEALGEAGAKIMLTSRKAADLEEAAPTWPRAASTRAGSPPTPASPRTCSAW